MGREGRAVLHPHKSAAVMQRGNATKQRFFLYPCGKLLECCLVDWNNSFVAFKNIYILKAAALMDLIIINVQRPKILTKTLDN